MICFGKTDRQGFERIAQNIFERLPAPILRARLGYRDKGRLVEQLTPLNLKDLDNAGQDLFASALDDFSRNIWRKPRARRQYRYDLAILVNPAETLPPSDTKALNRFVKAARRAGMDADIIHPPDFPKLAEYDALFIRATTAINDFTYRFARKAESEGMVVIDDPRSIIRCTNKVFLADLLSKNKIPAPTSRILIKGGDWALAALILEVGLPMVVKIPDGSFSRGVTLATTPDELKQVLARMFRQSSLLLVQAYMYTEFDWRIGILNQRPLFACRYFMVKGHWQIYKHGDQKTQSGKWDTLPTYEVPKPVLNAALKAANQIGNGLYGVDVKQGKDQVAVIEVNDNPSIESGVEDAFLGDRLYDAIMEEFVRRLDERGKQERGKTEL